LSQSQRSSFLSLVLSFLTIFSINKYDVGELKGVLCRIRLTDYTYINKRPYRMDSVTQAKLDELLECLLKYGIIQNSTSNYSSPVTLVDKKDEPGEKSRLCVDLRDLNDRAIPERYPFPRIDDLLDSLKGAKYFTCLDITSGFYHIAVHPEDRHLTAFSTVNNLFEWRRMTFGYKNAPAIFQSAIHNILRQYSLTTFAANYLDDTIIFSETFEQHMEHVRLVLQAMLESGIKLKASK